MNVRKPILVTGSHRSGTTWVGKMLAATPSVGYIHEPFNLTHRPGICTAKFPYWFTYINEENESLYLEPLKNTLEFRFDIGAELPAIQSFRHLNRRFALSRKRSMISWNKVPYSGESFII